MMVVLMMFMMIMTATTMLVMVLMVVVTAIAVVMVVLMMMLTAATIVIVMIMPATAIMVMMMCMVVMRFLRNDPGIRLNTADNALQLGKQTIRVLRFHPQLPGGKGQTRLHTLQSIHLVFHLGRTVGAAQIFNMIYFRLHRLTSLFQYMSIHSYVLLKIYTLSTTLSIGHFKFRFSVHHPFALVGEAFRLPPHNGAVFCRVGRETRPLR